MDTNLKKKFLFKVILLCMPFLFLFSAIILVDPYNYFRVYEVSSFEKKNQVSSKINYALWKIIQYKELKCPNIILGDSRMNLFTSENIKKLTGKEIYNFSYGGATLDDICATFWYAAKNVRLKTVYMGFNFSLFNLFNSKDRVSGAIATSNNPLFMLINRDVLSSSVILMRQLFTEKSNKIEKPPMSKDGFWDYQLRENARRYYKHYAYPLRLLSELQKINSYCVQNNISLIFIIPPTHVSLQRKVSEFGIEEFYEQFKKDLQLIGPIIDFNYANTFTQERNNFGDPFHIKGTETSIFINEIWGGQKKYGQYSYP